jgi:uncharacterized protein YuzE
MRITYSKAVDMLYLSFTPPIGKVATVENKNGDLLRIDKETGKVVGVTIQLFLYRIGTGEKIEIPELGFTTDSPIGMAFVESARAKVC